MQSLDDVDVSSPVPLPSETCESSIETCESSMSFNEALYTPPVKNELIPRIAQEFENLEDAHNFYDNYAKESGFGTRIHGHKKSKEGDIIRKEYVCCKQGVKTAPKNLNPTIRRRGITRVGCGAKFTVVKELTGEKFVVSQFVEGHNHPFMTPRRVHLLRSHRKVSVAQKAFTQQSDANVPTSQQVSILELQSSGLENIGFLTEDLYNVEKDRRKMVSRHDANMLYEYFQFEQEKNSSFRFTVKNDEDGRMIHCFWADATSRESYKCFGEVVVFDTTYNTNRYPLIFATIMGVNHHGQTTLFGCAFLSDGTSDSFEWLFKKWLKAMPAGPPKIIITDQDPAMAKAIATTLPNTHHRYCIWHIMGKFSEKLSALSYNEHYEQFKKCIWNTETPKEFEATWVDVVEKANLSSNEWLIAMYKIRDRWVPAYMKHIFSAYMTSSQRAENAPSFFKKCMSANNSLLDFAMRFDWALAKVRHSEFDLDHKDINEKPALKTILVMESEMSELYTQSIFYKFQDQLFQCNAYAVTRTLEDEHRCAYKVHRAMGGGARVREVLVEKSSTNVSCSCKMFESDGIPCRHMLAYFNRMGILQLPNQYILRRWTKSAKAMRVTDDLRWGQICDIPFLLRRQKLLQLASRVIDVAILSEEGTQLLTDLLVSFEKKLADMKCGSEVGETSAIQASIPIEHGFEEPLQVREKGCGKRLKGGKEKAAKKSRHCNGCGLTGQSHDKRNCPKLLNMSSQYVRLNDDDDEDNGSFEIDS